MNIRLCLLFLLALAGLSVQISAQKVSIEKQLQGHWKSTEAIIEFKPGSRVTINETEYDYAVVGSTIIVSNDEGKDT